MQSYLHKHAYCEQQVQETPPVDLKAIIVIPSYNEPELMASIHSLLECDKPEGTIEIIPVLNHMESSNTSIIDLHHRQFKEIRNLERVYQSGIVLRAIKPISLPDKIAGVGLARKIGMDEAVRRFESLHKDGVIINFDADCVCSPAYIKEVYLFFNSYLECDAVSIGFAHRWEHLDEHQKQAIILYELHLRCYIGWQKFHHYPFAFQTLGSCFAVRSKAYQAQGGMNRRKAGEDFYFLHKFSIHGKLGELNKPLVFPSGRISNRVPFGTGKGVHDIIHSGKLFMTYNPEAIRTFCEFMFKVTCAYDEFKRGKSFKTLDISKSLMDFLIANSFEETLHTAMKNVSTQNAFRKRIAMWFDPFCLMKYLHFAEALEFPDIEVESSSRRLINSITPDRDITGYSNESLLYVMRELVYRK
jgi:hypothetical protein